MLREQGHTSTTRMDLFRESSGLTRLIRNLVLKGSLLTACWYASTACCHFSAASNAQPKECRNLATVGFSTMAFRRCWQATSNCIRPLSDSPTIVHRHRGVTIGKFCNGTYVYSSFCFPSTPINSFVEVRVVPRLFHIFVSTVHRASDAHLHVAAADH